jgi:hypothetical protein
MLATFGTKAWHQSDVLSFVSRRDERYSAFKARVAQRSGLSVDAFRLRVTHSCENENIRPRPDALIPEDDPVLGALSVAYPWVLPLISCRHHDH